MGEWQRIADLFDFEKGSLQSLKCTPGAFTFITAAEEWKTHNEFTHDCEALIFAMGASGSLGRTHYFKGKFISSDLCFILQPKKHLKLDLTFYFYIFNFLRAEIVSKLAKGTSKLAINQKSFGDYKLPYFDYDHQLFFREKLKNIGGSTSKIGNEFDEQLSHLKQLRQAVLQEAVEGKLTAEWRKQYPVVKDDPQFDAMALLAQIKTEKERLAKEGKIRKEKPLAPIADDEKPFDLPDGWVWCRFGSYSRFERGRFSIRPRNDPRYFGGPYPFVQIGGLSEVGEPISTAPQSLNEKGLAASKMFEAGTILIAIVGGTIGNLGVIKIPMCFPDSIVGVRPANLNCHDYVLYLLRQCQPEIRRLAYQMAGQPNIKLPTLEELLIPLPPLAEQQAIVARVDSLMTVIDELEKQVAERKKQAQLLMQAVLREAFE